MQLNIEAQKLEKICERAEKSLLSTLDVGAKKFKELMLKIKTRPGNSDSKWILNMEKEDIASNNFKIVRNIYIIRALQKACKINKENPHSEVKLGEEETLLILTYID
jgi:hypothetical protein